MSARDSASTIEAVLQLPDIRFVAQTLDLSFERRKLLKQRVRIDFIHHVSARRSLFDCNAEHDINPNSC